ncbi:hypothetical protein P168DRAFT_323672 [Aspergillus campestris IBT 28561]|uniref:Uncharacterized protein n=1 Tax=Aspergillus campestris (strain IBT 28561) TaxID=1392248 RepID=A0A2I1DFA9_ASPC2|nr:uncharacterized protein P168DRAFT_323672 [Aspergillus campestris IBT 28561]PKY08563.1 hypothetical protein P168DRAFT_323672 [Aspergillus campestris IBT 28561]
MLLTLKPFKDGSPHGVVSPGVTSARLPRLTASRRRLHHDSGHPTPPRRPAPPPRPTHDDASQHYWQARAEEDRRRQEEERTRQETLRLEQRRVEQSMLRDSLQAGVPPHMVPLIFAGLNPGAAAPTLLEWSHPYPPQLTPTARAPAAPPSLSLSPRSPPRRSSHLRRESRSALPHHTYPGPPPPPVRAPGVLLSQPLSSSTAVSPTPSSLGRPTPAGGAPESRAGSRAPSTDGPAPSRPINLSHVHYAPGSSVPSTHSSPGPADSAHPRQSPPALYFHHWVPPGHSLPHPPSGRTHPESPGTSSSRRFEHPSSPGRKRKASGPHPPVPPPSMRLSASPAREASRTRPPEVSSPAWDRRRTEDLERPRDPPPPRPRVSPPAPPAHRPPATSPETAPRERDPRSPRPAVQHFQHAPASAEPGEDRPRPGA